MYKKRDSSETCYYRGDDMSDKKNKEYLTHAPKNEGVTIATDGRFPNQKNYPGDSVNEHESLETANIIISEGEIGQQRENL